MNRFVYGCIAGLAVLAAGCQIASPPSGAARRRSSKRRSTERRYLTLSRGTGRRWCSCTERSPTIGPGTHSGIRLHGSIATSRLTSAISDRALAGRRQTLLGRHPRERPCGVPAPARRRPGSSRRLVVRRECSARARGAAPHARQESVPVRARNQFLRHRPGRSQGCRRGPKKMFEGAIIAVRAKDEVASVRALLDGVNALPGTFDANPRISWSVALENARTLPLMFAAPRLPRSLAHSWARSRRPPLWCEGHSRRRSTGSVRIRPAAASRARAWLSCPTRATYGRRRIRPVSTARFWASWQTNKIRHIFQRAPAPEGRSGG